MSANQSAVVAGGVETVSTGARDWSFFTGVATMILGSWAFFLPRGFFDGFPIEGADWVSTLGEFNDHLMRDYGAAQVGLGIAAILVALRKTPTGISTVMAGYMGFGILHLGYHFTTFGFFPPASAGSQAVALTLFVLIPFVIWRNIPSRKEETL